jgi:autotransporter translocation and assembly factor TamB
MRFAKVNWRAVRTAVITLVLVGAVCLFVAAALLESGVFTPRILSFVNEKLASAAGVKLEVASLYWRPWSGLTMDDVRIVSVPAEGEQAAAAEGGLPVVLTIERLEVHYRFAQLFLRNPRFARVKLVRPALTMSALSSRRSASGISPPATEPVAANTPSSRRRAFRIDDLRVLDGTVVGNGELLVSRIQLTGAIEPTNGDFRCELESGTCLVQHGRIDETVQLTGDLLLEDSAVRTEGLHLEAVGGRVSFRGKLVPASMGESRLLITGFSVSLARLGSWFGWEHPALLGTTDFRIFAKGRPDAFTTNGRFHQIVDGESIRELRFVAEREGDGLAIESLRLRAGESRIGAHGRLGWGDTPAVEAVTSFSRFDPIVWIGAPGAPVGATQLDGTVRVEGKGLSRRTFDGFAEVEVTSGRLFGIPLESASLSLVGHEGEFVLRGANLVRGDTRITGVGSLDAQDRLAVEFRGRVADLADLGGLAGELPERALKGDATAAIRLLGPVSEPSLEADLEFGNAIVLGARAESLSVHLEAERVAPDAEGRFRIEGKEIGYRGWEVPHVVAAGFLRPGSATLANLRIETRERGALRLAGELDFGEKGLSGELERIELVTPQGDVGWVNAGPILLEKSEESLVFSGLELTSGTSRLAADIASHVSGETFVHVRADEVDLESLSPYLLLPRPLDGTLDLDADIILASDTLAVEIDLDLRDGRYGEQTLEQARGAIHLGETSLTFTDLILRSSFATGDISGSLGLVREDLQAALSEPQARKRFLGGLTFDDLELRFASPDLDSVQAVLPFFPSPGGRAELAFQLGGSSQRPDISLTGHVLGGRLGERKLDRVDFACTFHDSTLRIESCDIEASAGEFTAEGSVPLAWDLAENLLTPRLTADSIAVTVRSRRLPIESLADLSEIFGWARGPLWIEARLGGSGKEPQLTGEFSWLNGTLQLPEFDDPLVGGQTTGRFDSQGIEITNFYFRDGKGGVVDGSGRVNFDGVHLVDYSLELRVDDLRYAGFAGIRGICDGGFSLSPRAIRSGKEIPYLEGEFSVQRLDLGERIFSPEPTALRAPPGVTIPPTEAEAERAVTGEPPVLAELRFRGDKNLWLRTPQAEIEFAGDVTLHATEDYIGLTGEAQSLRGKYAMYNTEFDIDRGEIEFTDPADIGASFIDCVATTRVEDEDVEVHIYGTLDDFRIESTSASGLTEAEIYELLALRIKRRETATVPPEEQSDFNRAFLTSWGALLASRFGRNISRELGIDTFELDVGATSNVGVGKYLGRDVFVRYKQQVGSTDPLDEDAARERLETPERQLLVEYRLSKMFRIQGETGTIDGDGYLNLDLRAEWGY